MDLDTIAKPKKNPKVPDFRPGDTVRVMARVVEGERERLQAFEGVVIRKRRGGINSNFTVRRVSHGIGVERTFMLHSPRLESVTVVRVGHVRRAKLYYLRERIGKKARIRAGSRDRFEELARQLAEAEEELPEEGLVSEDVESVEEGAVEEESPEVEAEAEQETEPEAAGEPAGEPEAEVAAKETPEEESEVEAEAEETVEEPAAGDEAATDEEKPSAE